MANKKHYRKPIDKMSDDELYGSIRWAGDYISRLISDLESFRKYIQEALNAGKEGLDVESSKNTLYMISEKSQGNQQEGLVCPFLYGETLQDFGH